MTTGGTLLDGLRRIVDAAVTAVGRVVRTITTATVRLAGQLVEVMRGIARRHTTRLADDPHYRTQLGAALVSVVATAVPHPAVAAAIAALASVWLLGDHDEDTGDGWDDDPPAPGRSDWSPRPDSGPQTLWDRYND